MLVKNMDFALLTSFDILSRRSVINYESLYEYEEIIRELKNNGASAKKNDIFL